MTYFTSADEMSDSLGLPLLLRAQADPLSLVRHDRLSGYAVEPFQSGGFYHRLRDAYRAAYGREDLRGAMIWVAGPRGTLEHLPWAIGLAEQLARADIRAYLLGSQMAFLLPGGPDLRGEALPGAVAQAAGSYLPPKPHAVGADIEGVRLIVTGGNNPPTLAPPPPEGAWSLILAETLPESYDGPYPDPRFVHGVVFVAAFRDHGIAELQQSVLALRAAGLRLLGSIAVGSPVQEAAAGPDFVAPGTVAPGTMIPGSRGSRADRSILGMPEIRSEVGAETGPGLDPSDSQRIQDALARFDSTGPAPTAPPAEPVKPRSGMTQTRWASVAPGPKPPVESLPRTTSVPPSPPETRSPSTQPTAPPALPPSGRRPETPTLPPASSRAEPGRDPASKPEFGPTPDSPAKPGSSGRDVPAGSRPVDRIRRDRMAAAAEDAAEQVEAKLRRSLREALAEPRIKAESVSPQEPTVSGESTDSREPTVTHGPSIPREPADTQSPADVPVPSDASEAGIADRSTADGWTPETIPEPVVAGGPSEGSRFQTPPVSEPEPETADVDPSTDEDSRQSQSVALYSKWQKETRRRSRSSRVLSRVVVVLVILGGIAGVFWGTEKILEARRGTTPAAARPQSQDVDAGRNEIPVFAEVESPDTPTPVEGSGSALSPSSDGKPDPETSERPTGRQELVEETNPVSTPPPSHETIGPAGSADEAVDAVDQRVTSTETVSSPVLDALWDREEPDRSDSVPAESPRRDAGGASTAGTEVDPSEGAGSSADRADGEVPIVPIDPIGAGGPGIAVDSEVAAGPWIVGDSVVASGPDVLGDSEVVDDPEAAGDPEPEDDRTVSEQAAPVVSKDSYVVHLSSFRVESDAEAEARRLSRSGVDASFVGVEIPGKGRWYRIVTGSFATFAEAKQHALDLRVSRKFGLMHVIGRGGRGSPIPVAESQDR